MVGASLRGRVLLVDDVITAGTAIRESAEIIQNAGADFTAALIALNRKEKGRGDRSAIEEAENELGIKVISIVSFDDLIEFVKKDSVLKEHLESMLEYRRQYGV